ncbi:hypothetical protein DL89DRAFT_265680 [Linderina pennispora]|uniref:Uncharacterized protein n=1 Tax=Linderina pennispora TaxID=61395 RepID=A0A1Y1WEQ1_9FUNG|nr:uncharacterized protein DL89DRAFT_265680 [Linderina pennispora]ORX71997.1 hypothetical protein DL89DRAFT_265680 [Linderina pennispora]
MASRRPAQTPLSLDLAARSPDPSSQHTLSPAPATPTALNPHWGLGHMGVPGGHDRSVSRRSSVVSTSSSFFDRSFFATPETRIVDLGKKTTLSYATLMLNLYNDISLDLKTAAEANRRIGKAALAKPDLDRTHADLDDMHAAVREIHETQEFASIKDLLCRSLQVYEQIRETQPLASRATGAIN